LSKTSKWEHITVPAIAGTFIADKMTGATLRLSLSGAEREARRTRKVMKKVRKILAAALMASVIGVAGVGGFAQKNDNDRRPPKEGNRVKEGNKRPPQNNNQGSRGNDNKHGKPN
jgi:hypothetical protein